MIGRLEQRIDALERARATAAPETLDLSLLDDDDRALIASIGARCPPMRDGSPDLSQLSIPELRRLHEIAANGAIEIPSP